MRHVSEQYITDSFDVEWERAVNESPSAWERVVRGLTPGDKQGDLGGLFRSTVFGVRIDKCPDDAVLDWFGLEPVEHGGSLFLPPKHNLAVNTGLHTSAQRTFITTAGAQLTPVAGSTINGIRYGGVDNSVTAVAATTHQFDTTGGNRFIKVFDSDPIYTTGNKRMTVLFTITSGDTTIVHRRYGLTNDSANAANTLFAMLSGFILDFNGKTYDLTIEGQTNWTGS